MPICAIIITRIILALKLFSKNTFYELGILLLRNKIMLLNIMFIFLNKNIHLLILKKMFKNLDKTKTPWFEWWLYTNILLYELYIIVVVSWFFCKRK